MSYEKGEILITTEDIGSERKNNLIPAGAKVEFIKVVDADALDGAMIAFKHDGKTLVTYETNVKYRSFWKRRRAFKQFNNQMMINNPRLRRHHPNIFLKVYFRVFYFFTDKLGAK
tara:strand:+ start:460 stop:804 length:345 start_codon:yes stop_codon:yes gene_type:complete